MIHPRYWLPHRRAKKALVGYPVYTVPHPQSEETLAPALARENFDHFMGERMGRQAAFQAWLQQHFSVTATMDEPGLKAVNAWVKLYGGGLVSDIDMMRAAFYEYRPAWDGPFAGCNVMLDLAIFIGECMIAYRPRLRWICSLDCLKYHKRKEISSLGRPCIGGFPHDPWTVDVFQTGMGSLLDAKKSSESERVRKFLDRDNIIKEFRQVGKMADAPDDGSTFVF